MHDAPLPQRVTPGQADLGYDTSLCPYHKAGSCRSRRPSWQALQYPVCSIPCSPHCGQELYARSGCSSRCLVSLPGTVAPGVLDPLSLPARLDPLDDAWHRLHTALLTMPLRLHKHPTTGLVSWTRCPTTKAPTPATRHHPTFAVASVCAFPHSDEAQPPRQQHRTRSHIMAGYTICEGFCRSTQHKPLRGRVTDAALRHDSACTEKP